MWPAGVGRWEVGGGGGGVVEGQDKGGREGRCKTLAMWGLKKEGERWREMIFDWRLNEYREKYSRNASLEQLAGRRKFLLQERV